MCGLGWRFFSASRRGIRSLPLHHRPSQSAPADLEERTLCQRRFGLGELRTLCRARACAPRGRRFLVQRFQVFRPVDICRSRVISDSHQQIRILFEDALRAAVTVEAAQGRKVLAREYHGWPERF